MNWYYVDGAGQKAGPVDDAAFDALVASGTITSETLVWRDGMANWQPLREAKPGAVPASAPPPVTGGGEAVCVECGGLFPLNDTIKVGNARVCAKCKPVFVQKMREGMSVEQAGALNYARFGTRFAAYFLDGLILWIVGAVLDFSFGLGFMGSRVAIYTPGVGFSILVVGVTLLKMFLGLAYETSLIGKYGATLGKMACKIRVVMPDGSKVSYARALGRYFSKMVSSFTCMIGFIMAGFDPEKRALHDRMCNTRVVIK